eukprot:CAMPEP_0174581898 /NCGR_PEP_ID=MMETSP0929-20130131/5648_1 /TAXON_ID=548131 ORGANISM="Ostreococcus mediterraneus, Strain clade-D-RCC2572" /NCGR_SAMPLE_ID=MMETSP0929 /ASSEMBLY_ACC=CAM_ASM_000573 /LENGTH=129 /DNA_ID=CAMNT_0015763573 /DNA_START=14 /DNA_END=399 /DNA_ORIENTATION=-
MTPRNASTNASCASRIAGDGIPPPHGMALARRAASSSRVINSTPPSPAPRTRTRTDAVSIAGTPLSNPLERTAARSPTRARAMDKNPRRIARSTRNFSRITSSTASSVSRNARSRWACDDDVDDSVEAR